MRSSLPATTPSFQNPASWVWFQAIALWIWLQAIFTNQPAYITQRGEHVIRNQKTRRIYITPVPSSNLLRTNNLPLRWFRSWQREDAVARFIGDEFVYCPKERSDWIIIGGQASRGCYITGGGYNGYVVDEIGPFRVHRTFGDPLLEQRLLAVVRDPEGTYRYIGFPLHLFSRPMTEGEVSPRISQAQPVPRNPQVDSGGNIELQDMSRIMSWSFNPDPDEEEEVQERADRALEYLINGEDLGLEEEEL